MATTTRTDLELPVDRRTFVAAAHLRTAALVAAVVLSELIMAAAIADPRFTRLLAVPIALGAAAVLFRFPLIPATVMLVLGASVLHPAYFGGIGPARFHEVVLVGLLFVAAFRPRARTWGGTAGGALFVFYGLLVIANYAAVAAGRVEMIGAINWSRSLFLVSLFWVVIRLFPDRESLRGLVAAAVGVAGVTALVALPAALGHSIGQVFQDPGFVFVNDDSGIGIIKRVRFPGLALAYGLFWLVVMIVMHERGSRRAVWSGALALMVLVLLLSLNRNMWLGLFGGMGLVLAFAGMGVRRRLMGRLSVGFTVVVLFFSFVGAGVAVSPDSPIRPLLTRVGTLFNDPTKIGSQEKSLQGRAEETKLALEVIAENPLTGVGAGVPYGYYFNEAQPSGRFTTTAQKFLHNQWLWLTLVGGIPLVLAWAAFLGTTLRRAWGRGREPFTAAAAAGLAMIMVSALVELYFSTDGMTTAIGLLTGIVHAGRRLVDTGDGPLL